MNRKSLIEWAAAWVPNAEQAERFKTALAAELRGWREPGEHFGDAASEATRSRVMSAPRSVVVRRGKR